MKLTVTLRNDSVKDDAGNGSSADGACPIFFDGSQPDTFTLAVASDGEATTSRISLVFPSSVVGPEAVAKIRVATDGWSAQPDDEVLRLTRSSPAQLPLKLQLDGLASSAKNATAVDTLRVTVHVGAAPLPPALVPIMAARRARGAPSLRDALHVELTGSDRAPDVYYTPPGCEPPISNTLTLHLANVKPAGEKLVTDPWDGKQPTIAVSFVYGDDAGSLAPAADGPFDARKITVERLKTYGGFTRSYAWKTTQPDRHGKDVDTVWYLEPEKENTEVLGPTSGAIASFEIDGITTRWLGDTLLYLRFMDFPGYDDDCRALVIHKLDPPRGILRFAASAANVDAGEPVRLSWTTFAVAQLVLTYQDENDETVKLSSADGEPRLAPNESGFSFTPVTASSTVTLFAYDEFGVPLGDDRQQTITVNVPVVLDVKATPTAVIPGERSVITWHTKHAAYCLLQPSAVRLPPNSDPAHPFLVAPAIGANVFELTAYTERGLPSPNSRSATVSLLPHILSFEADPPVVDAATTPGKVTLSWRTADPSDALSITPGVPAVAGLQSVTVDVSTPTIFTLTAYQGGSWDSCSVAVVGSTTKMIAAGTQPCALALAPDGKKLYVCDRGSKSILAIDLASKSVKAISCADPRTPTSPVEPVGIAFAGGNEAGDCMAVSTGTAGAYIYINVRTDSTTDFGGYGYWRGKANFERLLNAFACSADGRLVFVDNAGTIEAWDAASVTLLTALPKDRWPTGIVALLRGASVYAVDPIKANGKVLAVDYSGLPCAAIGSFDAEPSIADLSNGASRIALSWSLADADGSVAIDDQEQIAPVIEGNRLEREIHRPTLFTLTATGKNGSVARRRRSLGTSCTTRIAVGADPVAVAMPPGRGRLYVANRGSNSISVIDTTAKNVVATLSDVGAAPFTLIFMEFSDDDVRRYFGIPFRGPALWVGCGQIEAPGQPDRDPGRGTDYTLISLDTGKVVPHLLNSAWGIMWLPPCIGITADGTTPFLRSEQMSQFLGGRQFPPRTVVPVQPWPITMHDVDPMVYRAFRAVGEPIPDAAWPGSAPNSVPGRTVFAVDPAANAVVGIESYYLSPP